MKKIILPLLLLVGFTASAQLPIPGSTDVNSRYRWLAGIFRQLKIPTYSDTTQYPAWQLKLSGDIMLDSTGSDAGLYIRYGAPPYWHKAGEGGGGGGDTSSQWLQALQGIYFEIIGEDTIGIGATPVDVSSPDGTIRVTGTDTTVFLSSGFLSVYNTDSLRNWNPGSLIGAATLGYTSSGDGGAGKYWWDASSTLPDDSGSVFAVTGVSTGRWRLIPENGTVWTAQFGALGTGGDYTQQLRAAINYGSSQGGRVRVGNRAGRFVYTSLEFVVTGTTQQNAGFEFFGAGRSVAPGFSSYGATTFAYAGDTAGAMMTIKGGASRFFKFHDFNLLPATNDAAKYGIRYEDSRSSSFTFDNVAVGNYRQMPMYGLFLEENGGANAEFNTFNKCVFNGTANAIYMDAAQALSNKFHDCQGSAEMGGTVINLLKSSGQNFELCDFSGIGATVGRTWTASMATSLGYYVRSNGNVYRANGTGTTGATAPSHTSGTVSDGAVEWTYIREEGFGTTLLALGGGQVDAVNYTGGRSENINRLVNFLSTSSYLTLNMTGVTVTTPEIASPNTPEAITYNGAIKANVNLTGMKFYTYQFLEGATNNYQPWTINIGASRDAQVIMRDTRFSGMKPMLTTTSNAESVTNNRNLYNLNNFQPNMNHVEAISCYFQNDPGGSGAHKSTNFSRVYTDNFGHEKRGRLENLLLQSRFTASTGSNVTATSPWGHTGTGSFVTASDMITGSEAIVSPTGKKVTIAGLSSVYQDLTGLTISGAQTTSVVTYRVLASVSGIGQVRFRLGNSATGIGYDSIGMVGSAASLNTYTHRPVEIYLEANVPTAQAGSVRVQIMNISNSQTTTLELDEQQVFTTMGSHFTPTTTVSVTKTQEWDDVPAALKIQNRLQIPVISDAYGRHANVEADGDLYISAETGKLMKYSPLTGWIGIDSTGGGGAGTVNTGAANTLAYYPSSGTAVDDLPAITANRALASDANGLPVAATTTTTELNYLSGVSSALQAQIDAKLAATDPTARIPYGVTTGGTTAFSVTVSPARASLTIGDLIQIRPNTTNSGATTLNVNGNGAVNLFKGTNQPLVSGDLVGARHYLLAYNGSTWQMVGEYVTTTTLGAGNANGISVAAGGVIQLHAATITQPGAVSAATQAFLGNKGFGIAPTARVHIAAGTTTANTAPLKIAPGALMATAEEGAVELTSAGFYVTEGSGLYREQLIGQGGLSKIIKYTTSQTLGTGKNVAWVIFVDASAGNVTLTLPLASAAATGTYTQQYSIKKIDNTANTVTIARAGSDTIDGATSYVINTQFSGATVDCGGTASGAWYVTGKF